MSDLFDLSRIEAGRIEPQEELTDLPNLVHALHNDIDIRFSEKQQTVRMQTQEDIPPTYIDPRLVKQIYQNLIINSIKYTPPGGHIDVARSIFSTGRLYCKQGD